MPTNNYYIIYTVSDPITNQLLYIGNHALRKKILWRANYKIEVIGQYLGRHHGAYDRAEYVKLLKPLYKQESIPKELANSLRIRKDKKDYQKNY